MTDQASRKLAKAFGVLSLVSLLVYGLGVFFMVWEVCTGRGAWISMFGVAAGLVTFGVIGSRALLVKTVSAWMAALVTLLVVAAMYWVASALAVVGCSGV